MGGLAGGQALAQVSVGFELDRRLLTWLMQQPIQNNYQRVFTPVFSLLTIIATV
ncbi:hypothetical protein BLL52_1051 [Rhodoferax antarcticus ANT.BR]|uniref:Uncharacterized protein n=1 Tax=Rhodoferax antarcticus ANT.BR TaxID=1111071 RepID=A0A1Q8YJ14_9BURK|nr:hypothetical protein BLL52_1051 [Rhodoferax antarcticus ANT.BR]